MLFDGLVLEIGKVAAISRAVYPVAVHVNMLFPQIDPLLYRAFNNTTGNSCATGIYSSFSYFQVFFNHIYLFGSVTIFVIGIKPVFIIMFMIVKLITVIITCGISGKDIPYPRFIIIGKIIHLFIMR